MCKYYENNFDDKFSKNLKYLNLNDPQNMKCNSNDHNTSSHSSSISNSCEEYICDSCLNDSLIYSKKLKKKNDCFIESMNNNKDELKKINDKVLARQKLSEYVANLLNENTNIEKLQNENANGRFWINNNLNYKQMKVLERYNKIESLNNKIYINLSPVDLYYKKYVDNYNKKEDKEVNEQKRKKMFDIYNKELEEQIKNNATIKKRKFIENEKYNLNNDFCYGKENEETEKRRKIMEMEINQFNLNEIKQHEKDKYNDKIKSRKIISKDEDYGTKIKNAYEVRKKDKEEKYKIWKEDLKKQIEENRIRKKNDKSKSDKPEQNKFTENESVCDETGKCCCCKRLYPLVNLSPKLKYGSLVRVEKLKRKNNNLK